MAKSRDAFRTISEVAEWLDIQAHVLRFWESKFTQVKPVKRAGGRRYYRPQDMLLLGGIKKLLHDDGMTIKGAQKLLREQGVKHVSSLSHALDDDEDTTVDAVATQPKPAEATPEQAPQSPAEPEAVVTPLFDTLPEQTAPAEDAVETEDPASEAPAVEDILAPTLFTDPAPEEETSEADAKEEDVAAKPIATQAEDDAAEAEAEPETPAEPEVAAQEDATPETDAEDDAETAEAAPDSAADPDEVLEDFVVVHLRHATHIHPAQNAQAAALAARFAALYAPEQESA